MKNWKALIAGFLVLCLLPFMPSVTAWSEEAEEEQSAEDAVAESYYYPIESNEIKDWPQGPAVESASAALMDMDTGVFLYSKQAKEKRYPASITKIMTTLLLIENCNLDDEITFSEIVYNLEEGSSHLGIQPGEKMTLRDAAYGIMLASANDISNGVAEYMAGSLSGFADMMNAKASELGCVNTHFSNPHGLFSEDHYTCAYDMALIAQAAYDNPVFREIATTQEYTIPKTNLVDEERSFLNHDKMMHESEEYYWDGCTGGKTGFTSDSLNTLVTFAERDGMRLVCVVLKVNGADKAYRETQQILEYGIQNFTSENFEKTVSDQDFYDIMGLKYLGNSSEFQSAAWKKSPISQCRVALTVPNTVSVDQLNREIVEDNGAFKKISYTYEGTALGWAQAEVTPVYVPAQFVFEKDIDVRSAEAVNDNPIQIDSLDEVLSQTSDIFSRGYQMVKDYTENHFLASIAIGGIILVILIVLIVVLIFRCTADSRIRRRRQQEEKERKKREEEIEKMTTAEIEAELRAVMEQERRRKEQELWEREEAERAAREAREMEEKAYETERMLDELERERLERISVNQKKDSQE